MHGNPYNYLKYEKNTEVLLICRAFIMERIIITIEQGKNQYTAWANEIPGIYAARIYTIGNTIDEVKNNLQNVIRIYKKHNSLPLEEPRVHLYIRTK